MNQKKIEKNLKTAAEVSPFVIAAGAAVVAGVGYALWKNRSKIQNFIQDQNLGESLNHLGDVVSEGAAKVTGYLNHDVKAEANGIRTAVDKGMDKVQAAAK